MPVFQTTQWSTVLQLGSEHAEQRARALARLCEIYWPPVYQHIRRKTPDDDRALDATQDFFAYIIDKDSMALADPSRGRFRTFLQTLANRFLINEWRAERRQKRAGGKTFVPIEIVEGDVADLTSGAGDPDTAFDCDWAQTVITRARNSVLAEYDKRNRRDIADAMLPHVLDTDYDYSKLSTSLGMSVANVRVAAHRIKRRFGDSIRATILETVADPADVDEELKYLISVIAKL